MDSQIITFLGGEADVTDPGCQKPTTGISGGGVAKVLRLILIAVSPSAQLSGLTSLPLPDLKTASGRPLEARPKEQVGYSGGPPCKHAHDDPKGCAARESVRSETLSRHRSDLLGRVPNDERQAQVYKPTASYRRGAHLEKLVGADERHKFAGIPGR